MTVLCTLGITLIIFTIISTALDERVNTSYEQKNVDDIYSGNELMNHKVPVELKWLCYHQRW